MAPLFSNPCYLDCLDILTPLALKTYSMVRSHVPPTHPSTQNSFYTICNTLLDFLPTPLQLPSFPPMTTPPAGTKLKSILPLASPVFMLGCIKPKLVIGISPTFLLPTDQYSIAVDNRWLNGVDVMLLKASGNIRLDKL